MATPEEVRKRILEDAAEGIASATIDGNSVSQMSQADRAAALDKEAAEAAKRSKTFGLRFGKLQTKGAMGS